MIDIDNTNNTQDMNTPTSGTASSLTNNSNTTMDNTKYSDFPENSLLVDISDALSEKDKVKFTVHTRTSLKEFQKTEFFVVRQHEEFVWLHDRFEENVQYAGYIIPPAPPRPDFDASREKLQRLGEGEGTMTKEEFTKMKQELEAEYLATFKKTVAMHEVFLTRLARHLVFRLDQHLHVFLEFDQDLCARPKNKLQLLGGLVKSLGSTTDQYYLGATVHDVDDFFEHELNNLNEYYNYLKEGVIRADRMTHKHKDVADVYILISTGIVHLATLDQNLDKFLSKSADVYEKIRKVEGRVASDEDLKLADTLRYYQRDTNAARSLLIRRLKCLAQYEAANRNLERVRAKNKDANGAEKAQSLACEQFEQISSQAKEELQDFRVRRVNAFKRSLVELAELEIKHARTQHELLRKSVTSLKELL